MRFTLEGEGDEECKVIARLGGIADMVKETKMRIGACDTVLERVTAGMGDEN